MRHGLLHVCLALTLLFALGQAAGKADTFTFGPRPRLRYAFEEAFMPGAPTPGSAEALARWEGLIRSAEKILADPPEVPAEGGQWIFYYSCPKDNCSLTLRKGRHTCPKCGRTYDDERTRLAYVTSRHHQLDNQTLTLARAWHVSGRDDFAAEVFRIMGRYAELHPTWERHDRWGRRGILAVIGGKRHGQSLDDATGIIKMAQAWDLARDWPRANPAARERIERDFLRATVESIYAFYPLYDAKNNHMTWFNAAAATVGAALGDAAMLDRAVNGPKGMRFQFAASVTAEGLWYEGTISYHFYALQAVVEIVRAARACGVDLTGEPAFRKMYLAPLELAWPDGSLPALNDGDRGTIVRYRGAYQFAARCWEDPVLQAFAERAKLPAYASAVYSDAGLAYLRRGAGENAVTVILDYGQHGGHHGHPDKLNVLLYALGREIFFDPGKLTYRCPEHETWTRQTVAHNTVVIDRRSQAPVAGTLLAFTRGEGFDAVAAEAAGVYPGVCLRRALVLADNALVDLFHVGADRKARMDWLLHSLAPALLPDGFAPLGRPLGADAGYQHLGGLSQRAVDGPISVDWQVQPGRFVRTLLLADAPAVATAGNGIGYELADKAPFVMLTREGASAVFAAVHDLSGDGSAVSGVSARLDPAQEIECRLQLRGKLLRIAWDAPVTGRNVTVERPD